MSFQTILKKQEGAIKEAEKKRDEMVNKLKETEERASGVAKLERENRYLRKEVQHLSAQTVKAKKSVKSSTVRLRKAFDTTMKEVVSDLLEMDQVQTVVVADAEGKLVGGVGETETFDGLAELCGRVGSIGQETENGYPLADMRSAHFKDIEDGIVACRMFRRSKETLILGTIGRNSPPGEGIMELTVADLTDEQ